MVDAHVAAEAGAGITVVDVEIHVRTDEDRQAQQERDRTDERRPREERSAQKAHPRGPCGEGGGRHGSGDHQTAESENHQRSEIEIDHLGFSATGATVADDGGHSEAEASEPEPETRGGEPRKGDGACPELERHDGDDHAENERHDCAVGEQETGGGEHLGGRALIEELEAFGIDSFDGDENREDESTEQTDESRTDEETTHVLVVRRCQPRGNGGLRSRSVDRVVGVT